MSKFDCSNYVVRVLKVEHEWLKEPDKYALTNSVFAMDDAYKRFFTLHSGYPKFKSKHNHRRSYTTCACNSNIDVLFDSNRIKLPKLRLVKAKLSRPFFGRIKQATVSQTPSGKYFVSILVDTEHEPLLSSGGAIGIDLGIKDLLITSNGEKYDNPKLTQRYAEKLAREQRSLSRKSKGSNNYNKQRIKVARVHEKIHNTRIDNLHKITHKLISENQVIVSEDLSVSDMVQNLNLAKSISDCGWYELTRQLSYKAEWNGRTYIKIGRYTKSSQPCSVCGYINTETKDLSVREWACPECGMVHDRDINAAINILNEGMKLL
nr:MAG TPA: endonuclease [Caudoviricetes sp.]